MDSGVCQRSASSGLLEDSTVSNRKTDWHLAPLMRASVFCGPTAGCAFEFLCFTEVPTNLAYILCTVCNSLPCPLSDCWCSGQTLSAVVDRCRGMSLLQPLHPKAVLVTVSCFVWGARNSDFQLRILM